ncbi:Bud-site selection protein [Irpex rosettiformis]|uniref:Bud-site selection protein n=1 Tax=Irpex rosettiformis TaxID=378272 RepID=A0ACB8TWU0_9APHY|nr:Bud-site selection protein [Irpex rosettiformis]
MTGKGRMIGTKRKRSDSSQEHHHVREVRKAAKKAKTFELQKTVKKLKGLRSKTPDSAEIPEVEAQLEILKKYEPEPFANTALRTKINKDKFLSADEHLSTAIAQELSSNLVESAAPGSNEAKVQGRLLSSKIIAMEVASVVETLRAAVSPELGKKKGRATAEDEEEGDDESEAGEESEGNEDTVPTSKKAKLGKVRMEEEAVEDGESDASSRVQFLSDDEGEVDDAGWESGSVHEGPEDMSDESSNGEAEGKSSGEDNADDKGGHPSRSSEKDLKTSSSNKNAKAQPEKTKKSGESTFLPSLAVGFIRGDSDVSDFSDDDAGIAPKKNRRGQRARQAIWEKKYGRNANHVKKQQEISGKGRTGDRAGKGGPQRFARGHSDKGWPRQPPPSAHPVQAQASQLSNRAPRAYLPSSPPSFFPARAWMILMSKEEKSLHPSWAAKKMLKEKQNPVIIAPQGKKIVF